METKICNGCGLELPVESFGKRNNTKDGFHRICKKCHAEKQLKYYYENQRGTEKYKKMVVSSVNKRKPTRNNDERERRKKDNCYSVNYNQYRRIMWEINTQKTKRFFSYEELIGKNKKDYYEYLLSLGYVKSTMWVDHIVPLSLFDLSDEKQQRIGCHYLNTRPILVAENIKKRNILQSGWEQTIVIVCSELGFDSDFYIQDLKSRYISYSNEMANKQGRSKKTNYILPK
jgi:hypothetical protein